jgi:hypothetical protein
MNILAKPPQQETPKDLNVLHNAEEITQLRTQLGLPAISSPRNLAQSRAMLQVLRDMAAHSTTVAVAPAAATALTVADAASEAGTLSLKQFYSLGIADRAQAARDGRPITKTSFDKMTLASKSAWCVSGGKILDDSPVTSRNLSTAARSFGNS